ncbi:vacuolar protein sorting-associated protein 51 [Dorcoceras hygrometricum]|uniref:Vacuolar protein sorting-associated protein 51 n=1 Tax=Dorcoceras hygrometricum TaxID=472368 RepID=A0A2Z7BRR5_9LAMI|nr:vacuolar protein sorting-associated protein 51 [Dorcoceras hygrometricum]
MASAFITNALRVNFDSVLWIHDNEFMATQLLPSGEAKTFPPLKILSAKTVNTYIATNKTIDARGESDEPVVAKIAIVKKKSVSRKKSVSIADKDADDVHVEKRTTSGKAVSKEKDQALLSMAQDAVATQALEPISAVPAARPHAQKPTAPKRKLRMTTGSDDEIFEKEPAVETMVVKQKETTYVNDVDTIIEQVISETAQMGTDVIEPDFGEDIAMGTDLTDMEEPVRTPGDMMLPSVFAAEPTKIKFSNGISIPRVANGDCFNANLPKIALADMGKAPLDEPDTIKGHPAREMFHLICGDIEFLVQLRERVIDEVATFFSSFSLCLLAVLKSLNGIAANEEKVLTWGETDSVQIALQRILYILAKYREMLLRKFLESH